MRVAIFGAHGLLGQALTRTFVGETLIASDRDTLDITDRKALAAYCGEHAPEVMINVAAYNAVDDAERTQEGARLAGHVNGYAVQCLAAEARRQESLFVHFSTDYVSDGLEQSAYDEEAVPHPLSVYGRSKLEGEEAVLRASEQGLSYYLIRTSRLFGSNAHGSGKKTFVDVVREVAARGEDLAFIEGEISSPTYADDLAHAVYDMVRQKVASGVYHRTNDGECSWYEFAEAVLKESGLTAEIRSITAAELKRAAPRPAYSTLRSTKLPPLRHWREALREYLT